MEKITLPQISIIIPVYNCEKHMCQMLDSVMAQTYENIEVIIAYDTKSTDSTLEILKTYQKKSPFNFIIDKGNDTSIGEARNRGYKFATGDFIAFLDADDYILPTMMEDYSQALIENSDCDISTGKYKVYRKENKMLKQLTHIKTQNLERLSYKFVSPALVLNKIWNNYEYSNASWNYLIRKSLIDKYEISYPDMSHGEDQLFMITSFKNARKIAECNHFGYMYIVRSTSVSHSDLNKEDDFIKKHEKFIFEYQKILKNDFPTIPIFLEIEYLIRNLAENTSLPLSVFLKHLRDKGIYKIPIPPINWKVKWAVRAFNISHRMFYFISRLYKHLIR